MPAGQTLRSVLSHLKKRAPRFAGASGSLGDDEQALLSALLLSVACKESDEKRRRGAMEELYALAQRLAPPGIASVLPFPDARHWQPAYSLLPAPPHVVATLDPCIVAYLYQFFCSGLRDQAKLRMQTADKPAHLADTIAFTQLYTPTKVVDQLLKESLLSGSATLIDPSCGAGNFLLRAFDLLLEMKIAGGQDKQAAAAAILKDSLHGCDIDPIGLWVTALSLSARLKDRQIEAERPLNLAWLKPEADGALLGALSPSFPEGHMLTRRFDAVVGNPPYLGRKLLDRRLKQKLKELYPDAHQDLCNAFIKRGLALLKSEGRLAYITQSSLLYLPTYAAFRKMLIEHYRIVLLLEAGAGVFPLQAGQKVQSVLIVLENSAPDGTPAVCAEVKGAQAWQNGKPESNPPRLLIDQRQFLLHRGNAFHYRCPSVMLHIRSNSDQLAALAEIRQGLATSDNERFVKWWWQVPADQIKHHFVPYVKGAGGERWYAPIKTVIDWQDNGCALKQAVADAYPYLQGKTAWVVKNERFYFRRGLTFSLVNTKQLSVRQLPEGCIFDVAGSAVFAHDGQDDWLLAYLNSSLIAAHADILNPTVNYQVGDLKALPVIPLSGQHREHLSALARRCVDVKKQLSAYLDADIAARQPVNQPLSRETFEREYRLIESLAWQLSAAEAEVDDAVLAEAHKHFQLDRDQQKALAELCAQAVTRRKPLTLPFSCADEYARLKLRFLLYELAPCAVDGEQLRRQIGASSGFLEKAIGLSIIQYVRQQFETDQRKQLNNTVRVAIEAAGENGVRLISQ